MTGPRASFLLAAFCAFAGCLSVRGSWMEVRPEPGQFQQGFFEEVADEGHTEVALMLSEPPPGLMFPSLSFTHARELSVPPGSSAAVTLVPGADYAISGAAAGTAPYVVLGIAPGEQLLGPTSLGLEPSAASLVLEDWDASRPFAEDRDRLRAVSAACVGTDAETPLEISVDQQEVRLSFGRCVARADLGEGIADGAARLGLIAGDQWLTLSRIDGGLRANRSVARDELGRWLFRSVLLVAVLTLAFGPPTSGLVATLLFASSFAVHPLLSALSFLLAGLLGVVALPAVLLGRLLSGRGAALRWGSVALLYAVAFGYASHTVSGLGDEATGRDAVTVSDRTVIIGEGVGCVLAGYSTVDDVGLRVDTLGASAVLSADCSACSRGVGRYGQSGRTFAAIKEFGCADDTPLQEGTPLFFLGGTNDDIMLGADYFFWANRAGAWNALATLYETMVRGLYYLERPTGERLRRLMDDASDRAVATIDSQRAVVGDTMDCVAARGSRLRYYHDFTILDLAHGRSTARASMRDARRETVDDRGGHFVDLLDAFGAEAGVAWFNDYVHLSTLGHRRVAELMCEELSSD